MALIRSWYSYSSICQSAHAPIYDSRLHFWAIEKKLSKPGEILRPISPSDPEDVSLLSRKIVHVQEHIKADAQSESSWAWLTMFFSAQVS